MPDTLLEKRDDGVALITLNRPDSMNSMGGQLMPLFAEYLADCERDRTVRCVAVTGAGRAFCAGGDVKEMQARPAGIRPSVEGEGAAPPNVITGLEESVRQLRHIQRATAFKLHAMAKPTVALVNGFAMGAGLSIALSCDLRVFSDRARWGTAFRNIALSGDFGGHYFLQHLIGYGRARELYFTAEVQDAQRALDLGIANRVVPHDELLTEGLAFCAKLAAGPTATLGRMKDNQMFAAHARLDEVMDQEAHFQRISGLAPDSREAVAAFVEKRDPKFTGR